MTTVTGNTATVGFSSNGTAVVTKPSASLGGTSGWSTASNFGIGRTATGVAIGQTGEIALAAGRVPVTMASNVTKAAALQGMGRMIGALIPLGNAALGLYLMGNQLDEMYQKGGLQVNKGPDGQPDPVNPFKYYEADCENGTCYEYKAAVYPFDSGWVFSELEAANNDYKGWKKAFNKNVLSGNDSCNMRIGADGGHYFGCGGGLDVYGNPVLYSAWTMKRVAQGTISQKVGNWAMVRPKFESADFDLQKLVDAQLAAKKRSEQHGFLDWGLEVDSTQLSGPASLDSVTETKKTTRLETGADGITREVTETKTTTTARPIQYTQDGVKINPTETTVTTTQTKNPDGSVETKTDSETTETETTKDESDLCKDHPDILACAKPDLDTPDVEIQKKKKTIAYQEENLFGDGSCPADLTYTLSNGQSLKVWDWQYACEKSIALRYIIISLATFGAYLIVMPGSTRV